MPTLIGVSTFAIVTGSASDPEGTGPEVPVPLGAKAIVLPPTAIVRSERPLLSDINSLTGGGKDQGWENFVCSKLF